MADPTPPFAFQPPEQLVLWRPAGSLHGLSLTTGRVWVTNQRLVFQPVVLWLFWLAPLVGLILWLMNKSHRLELPLDAIATHARTKFGRNPNVLVLTTKAGTEHKLIIDDWQPFADALTGQPAFTSKLLAS